MAIEADELNRLTTPKAPSAMQVALLSCAKRKLAYAAAAQDLYTSPLFTSMRTYARKTADQWFILSATHGVLKPEDVVSPYERTLNHMSATQRQEWAQNVQRQLLEMVPVGAVITILAGKRYREHLVPFLRQHSFAVNVPMEGLGLGYQLQWLNKRNGRGSIR